MDSHLALIRVAPLFVSYAGQFPPAFTFLILFLGRYLYEEKRRGFVMDPVGRASLHVICNREANIMPSCII